MIPEQSLEEQSSRRKWGKVHQVKGTDAESQGQEELLYLYQEAFLEPSLLSL